MNKKTNNQEDHKVKNFKRFKDAIELSNNIMKTTNGAIKMRCSRVMKSLINKNNKIQHLEGHHKKFKETVVKYHKTCIEKNKDEEMAFLNAIEKSQFNGPSFNELLEQQMKNLKPNHVDKVLLNNKENVNRYEDPSTRNLSTLAISPIYSSPNVLGVKRKIDDRSPTSYHQSHDMSMISEGSGGTSPISFNDSINFDKSFQNSIPFKFYQNHSLMQNPIVNKTCSYCKKKDSKSVMYKCKQCAIYIHGDCRCSDQYKICIPLKKISVKLSSNSSVNLADLNINNCNPLVPNVFLAVIHHIHLFGLKTENIFTMEGKDKEVKELCNRLLEGKLKYLIKSDIRIVANAFLMFLKSLKEPILPMYVARELLSCIGKSPSKSRGGVLNCMKKLPSNNLDTLVYVLLHLQVISKNPACKFNSERLAELFAPILTATHCDLKITEAIKMLIELDFQFYNQFFLTEKVFFMPYFSELSQLNNGANLS